MDKFIALDGRSEVRAALYIKTGVPPDVLYNAAAERQYAARGLLDAIGACEIVEGEAKGISNIARAIAILVSDAESLYEAAFNATRPK
ncbi:hypothetical protein [Pseudomonas huaxiensis]|uniref:hypothetical protein n=1 Tax=Pseudomonas huaxiensis TaxID=2213017 RepID=UPI0013006669|nr:hypothetical protein [Pseudomonas huaxiensis]